MEVFKLSGTKRKHVGRKASEKLREAEHVPCVIYGGKENIHFSTELKNFNNLVYTPNVYLIDIDVDGTTYRAVMQDIQFHPINDKIQHIDFVEVVAGKPVIIDIPIKLVGNSIGIQGGGKLRQRRRYLRVKGLAEYLPNVLEIDMTNIDVGDFVHVRDLEYDNLELLDPAESSIVGIVSSRAIAKGMLPEEEGEEGEEGEGEEGAEAGEEGAEATAEESKE